MSDRQSFAKQLAWTKKTAEYLENLKQHVHAVSEKYTQHVNALHSADYMDELMPQLRSDQQGYSQMAGAMIKHIDQVHIQYMRGLLADLGATENEIRALFGNSGS